MIFYDQKSRTTHISTIRTHENIVLKVQSDFSAKIRDNWNDNGDVIHFSARVLESSWSRRDRKRGEIRFVSSISLGHIC